VFASELAARLRARASALRTAARQLIVRYLPSEGQHLFALTLLVGIVCGLVAELSLKERATTGVVEREQWDYWVEDYLRARHSGEPKTLSRNLGSWGNIREFLRQREVVSPRHLTRDDCFAYIKWRKSQGHVNSRAGKKVKHNTVLWELKTLTKVMKEAVLRNYTVVNPSLSLGLEKERVKQKPELTDQQIAVIRAAIQRKVERAATDEEKRNAHFYHVSFEIALAQGFRLAETYIALKDIDEQAMTIRVIPKGDEAYETELNPSLVPLITRLRAEGRTHTYDEPKMPSLKWFKLFDNLRAKHPDLKDASFHSTRVTVITRLERAGAKEKTVMDLVNHASTTVHRIYRRSSRQELRSFFHVLPAAVAPPAAGTPASP